MGTGTLAFELLIASLLVSLGGGLLLLGIASTGLIVVGGLQSLFTLLNHARTIRTALRNSAVSQLIRTRTISAPIKVQAR